MSLIGDFKRAPAQSIKRAVILTATVGGIAYIAVRQNQMQKQITELQKVAELNATVTLNLVNSVGQLTGVRRDSQ